MMWKDKIWVLEYDHDWGTRGSRRKSKWFFLKKMNKKETIIFLENKMDLFEPITKEAIEWHSFKIGKEYTVVEG